MSRSIRKPARPRETRTPRQRVTGALEQAERLRGDQPPERQIVAVRVGDLRSVMTDCPEPEESQSA